MTQSFIPFATQLIQSAGWGLLHSLWQGALIWFVLSAIYRTFGGMSARLKHGCALMALLLLSCWVANTTITQWQQLQTIAVRVTPGNTTAATGYDIEVQPKAAGFGQVRDSAFPQLNALMPWLMLGYGIGLLFMLLRLGGALNQLRRLRRHTSLPDERLLRTLNSLQLQLGIAQMVLLRLSTRVAVPIVIGALRPMILLPATLVETLRAEELEAILLHELAHISRADFLINMIQSVVETLLFFNPFVWRISASIRREREHCCDDLVIAHTSEPFTYARALATLAQQKAPPVAALAASGQSAHLLNRIKRIIEMKNQPLRSGHLIAACSLAAILIAVSIVCFTPSLAQKGKKKSVQKPTQQQASITTGRASGFVYTDSNGNHHEYGSFDDLPAGQQALIKSVFKNAIKSRKADLVNLEALQPYDEDDAPVAIDVDSIAEAAMKTAAVALEGVDWDAIGRQVDSAMGQVAVVEWPRMSREIRAGLAEAQKGLADPAWKAQIRRQVAGARREIAMATRGRILVESQRSMEQARREVEQAEQRMEQARMEMAQAREELKRLRREQSSASGGYRVRVIPAPAPTPPSPRPFANDIPAPPASIATPAPSVAVPMPVAPRAGSSRRSSSEAPQQTR